MDHRLAHAEAALNAVLGIVIAQVVLWLFGIPLSLAIVMNLVMLAASYARSFVLRILFARLARP